jgi:hypothetical protein
MANTRFNMSRQLQRNLEAIPELFKKAIKGAIIKSALRDVQTPARLHCRVDTGRLRASIHTEYTRAHGNREQAQHNYTAYAQGRRERATTRSRARTNWTSKINTPIGPMEVIVGTDVHYARKIERMDGMLINAYESSKPLMRREIQSAVHRLINRR